MRFRVPKLSPTLCISVPNSAELPGQNRAQSVQTNFKFPRSYEGVPVQVRASALGIRFEALPFCPMAASVDFTIAFDEPDEDGWIVARVLEVPGAISQGRTREEARENVVDALRTVLTPDEELAGKSSDTDLEHVHFVAAA